jgi:hypothetical protein
LADFVCHFDVEDDDGETITRMGRLMIYHEPEGKFQVKIDGQKKTYDLDQLNKIKYQKFEDDSQKEMFE